MFIDRAIITVKAGNGGDGCVSFRREKFEAKGGPNGGDGGDGGSVILHAEEGMSTLYDYRFQALWGAEDGGPGRGKQCHGANGQNLILRFPPGTMVFNEETGELLHDLKPGEDIVLARGGRGGYGNEHYKSSTNQTPRTASAGTPGEQFNIRLELKLIADVGIIGKPNAGKSTLLKALTRANPKIANYPFTTLSPQLGIADAGAGRRIVLADIPGLIEGAAQGAGLGHDFLRHVERTRVLLHLLDLEPGDGTDPVENYRTVRAEIAEYSEELGERQELIVLNKLDLIPDEKDRKKAVNAICKELELRPGRDVLAISGAASLGLDVLLEKLWGILHPSGGAVSGWKADPAENA